MNKMISDKEFRNCPYVMAFLSKSENEWDNVKKQAKKQKQFMEVDDLATLDGFVISKVTKQAGDLISAFSDYCPESAPYYDRVKLLTKKLMSDFDGLSSTLFHLADTYKGLFDCTDSIVNKHNANDFSKLNESYLRLSNLMTDWGNTVTSQIQLV